MIHVNLILLILSAVCLLLAAAGVTTTRVRLDSLGLFFLVCSMLIR